MINAINSAQTLVVNPVKVKTIWQPINGVVLLDKGLGLSSNQALQQVRRVFKAAKAGHTGTLDPLATGLLPLCLGESSKFSQGLLDADKTYTARLCLGIMTATGDVEGAVLSRQSVQFTLSDLNAVIRQFTGALEQIPPMYSALKHQGKPLYELARQGIEIQRQPRAITVYELKVTNASFFSPSVDLNSATSIAAEAGQAWIDICATVSKGTYIRTLGQDIGAALGCGAHLSALRRTAIADWHVADAHELTALQAMNLADLNACLLPVDSMLLKHPKITLNSSQANLFGNGGRVKLHCAADESMPNHDTVRVYYEHTFLGIAALNNAVLHPIRLVGRQ